MLGLSRSWRLLQLIMVILTFTLAACSDRPETTQPNILLIVMDAVRADELSCYGYHRATTPNLDNLAKAGVRFTNAVSTSSWTSPSHASLFTGLAPDEHGVMLIHNWLVNSIPTLAELLKDIGYKTAGFSNNPLISGDHNMDRGFDLFEAVCNREDINSRRVPHDTELTNSLVENFIVSSQKSSEPFFVFINYMDAHTPYSPPEPYRSRFLVDDETVSPMADSANFHPTEVRPGGLELSRQDYITLRNLYDGALSYLDFRIGKLLDYLQESGLSENTLIIVTSDHGEIFGRWEHFTHSYLLNRPLIHIPLIMSLPARIPAGLVSDRLVSITDIFHTIIELSGAEGAAPTGAPRADLLDFEGQSHPCYSTISVNSLEHESFPNYYSAGHSLWTTDGKHLIVFPEQAWEFYDLNGDFAENDNLYPKEVTRQQIERQISEFRDMFLPFTELPSDFVVRSSQPQGDERLNALRALGYVGMARNNNTGDQEDTHTAQHRFYAEFLISRERYGEAAAELEKVLKLVPDYFEARIMLGTALYVDKKFDQIERAMKPLIGTQPDEVAPHLIMSLIYQELGDTVKARVQYQAALTKGIDGRLPTEIRNLLERL